MRKLGWSLGKGMMKMKGMSIRRAGCFGMGRSQWTHWVMFVWA